jgi:hypothetical protein
MRYTAPKPNEKSLTSFAPFLAFFYLPFFKGRREKKEKKNDVSE